MNNERFLLDDAYTKTISLHSYDEMLQLIAGVWALKKLKSCTLQ
jgi:hypothetical protein